MKSSSLQDRVNKNQNLEGVGFYSTNSFIYFELQQDAIRQLDNIINTTEDSSLILKQTVKTILSFVPNFCFSLEAILHYSAAIFNPISRYDFSECSVVGKTNPTPIINSYFFANKEYLTTEEKLKFLFGFILNSVKYRLPKNITSDKKYINNKPVQVEIKQTPSIDVIFYKKIPFFTNLNINNFKLSKDIVFKRTEGLEQNISLDGIFTLSKALIDIRNYIVHPSSHTRIEIKEFLDYFNDLRKGKLYIEEDFKEISYILKGLVDLEITHLPSILKTYNILLCSVRDISLFVLTHLHVIHESLRMITEIISSPTAIYPRKSIHVIPDKFFYELKHLPDVDKNINLIEYIKKVKDKELDSKTATILDVKPDESFIKEYLLEDNI